MEVGITEAVVGGLLTVLGGFIGKGIDWVLAKSKVKIDEQKAESQVKTSEVEKAAAMYREMVADLRKDIDEMFALLKQLEQERLDCRVENAALKAEVKALKEKVEGLERDLKAGRAAA